MSAPYGKPVADLNMAERDQEVVALKREGLSFQQIANQLGLSKAGAIRSFQRAKKRVEAATDADYSEYLAEQLARIAAMREVAMDIVAARHVAISNGKVMYEVVGCDEEGKPIYGEPYEDDGPVLAAIDRVDKLDDREARLLQLYPKTEVNHSGDVTYRFVGVDPSDLV